MMETCLYLTADRIGDASGGGLVTFEESKALQEFAVLNGMGSVRAIGREELTQNPDDALTSVIGEPWIWDVLAYHKFGSDVKLCHLYSGCFPESVQKLKQNGAKVVYTVAAHSVEASRKAHADLGLPYPYNHLTDPLQWRRYSAGYWMADAIVVPSTYSERVVQEQHQALFGKPHPKVVIIPHGCHVPEKVAPLPRHFTVGYLGSVGAADKFLPDLLMAWKELAFKDASLMLAGRDSTSDWVRQLVERFGGGSVILGGWQKDVASFYSSVSVYCQPSRTEGFGLEVLEAMAYGRPVICSEGAGVSDLVEPNWKYQSGDVKRLCLLLDRCRTIGVEQLREKGISNRESSQSYSWDKIRGKYIELWRGLL